MLLHHTYHETILCQYCIIKLYNIAYIIQYISIHRQEKLTQDRMIHEAKVTFHNLQYFHFTRKQEAQLYDVGREHEMNIMIDRINLTFLATNEDPICKIKTRTIDFNIADVDKPTPDNQVTILFIPPASKSGEVFHVKLATIKSSKKAIESIKQSIDKKRKYKSCLSFVPSRVKHISILSGDSPTQKFRGFLNLAGIMFLILNLRNIIENFLRYGIQFGQTPTQFIPITYMVAMVLYLGFLLNAYAIQKLKFRQILAPAIANFFSVMNLAGILAFNVFYCLLFKPSPFLGILHTALALIILMKLISYYQVNKELYSIILRLEKRNMTKSQKEIEVQMFTHYEISEQNLQQIKKYQGKAEQAISLKNIFQFFVYPTLCYQITYPKTSSIRYTWLAKRLTQLILITGIQAILWFQYLEPELNGLLNAIHSHSASWFELFNRHLRLSIPNTLIWIAGFYGVFHLWLNIMGELTYFGDRNFYRDWWNCRSIEEYWKTWNLPVHFWFIRHVYNPLLQVGVSKLGANLMVFFISAIAHEYLVSVPLGFISYWAFLAMMMQAPVIFIQRKLGNLLRIQNSELNNVSFWLFFCIIGQPIVVFIYYTMYIDFTRNIGIIKVPSYIPLEMPDINLTLPNINLNLSKLNIDIGL